MTLETQKVHLADAQIARIGRPVRRVTTAAAFCLHRNVLVNERPCFICVAFFTDRVPTWHGSDLPKRRGSVDVVAVGTFNEAFVHAVVKGFGEVGLCCCVAAIAKSRLRARQEVLGFFRVVRGVAIDTSDVAVGVW